MEAVIDKKPLASCRRLFSTAKDAARPMTKQPLLSNSGSGVPQGKKARLRASFGTRPEFLLVHLAIGMAAIVAAYEVAQFILGACQGYSGAAAFERSIFGQHFELWSVDPMKCR